MKLIKVLINPDNEGEIICPVCGKARTVNVSSHRIPQKPVKVKCACGATFNILLEYRKYHRKKVKFQGKLMDAVSRAVLHEITVTSLSVTGIGFEIHVPYTFAVNDSFAVEFTLDDDLDSVVQEDIIVRRINGNFIGAEFSDQDKYNFELDFYITAHASLP
jgi:hypothetical protein